MEIITLTDDYAGMNTYVVREGDHCFFIDPIRSDELRKAADHCTADFAILTHEHYDHIRGVNGIRKQYPGLQILCGRHAEKGLTDESVNMSKYMVYLLTVIPFGNGKAEENCHYTCSADRTCGDEEIIPWEGHQLYIRETPGHSAGSISILADGQFLFSGDVIFKDYPTATRLPGGSTKKWNEITKPWLEGLPQDIMVYPGHTEPFLLKQRYQK
ncbi:MAG: MBL fold metallo-hydrolase [Clostridia bacterium]|nr:MBL fold metallo-hydrolase [Clostridia bacterium]